MSFLVIVRFSQIKYSELVQFVSPFNERLDYDQIAGLSPELNIGQNSACVSRTIALNCQRPKAR